MRTDHGSMRAARAAIDLSDGGAHGGAPCAAGDVVGICHGADAGTACVTCVCGAARCGDGFVTAPEQCDDAALGDEPLCTDHGYYESTSVACSSVCEYDVTAACSRTCGDGRVELARGEQCDDDVAPLESCTAFGYDAGFAACRAGGCSPDLSTCRRIGWAPVVSAAVVITAVATSGEHVFVAGSAVVANESRLVIWHFDGVVWSPMSTDVDVLPQGMYASSPTDIWVTGSSFAGVHRIAHYNGTTWTEDAAPARCDTNVYAAGETGTIWHFDGTSWTSARLMAEADTLIAISGTGASDIVAATARGQLYHFDGQRWSPIRRSHDGDTSDVLVKPNAIWMVGDDALSSGGSQRTLVLERSYVWN